MELLIPDLEMYAPVTLRGPRLSDEEFLAFCAEHEDLRVESNAEGELEVMPGTGLETGDRNAEIAHQLRGWSKANGLGRSYDSSTLFVLPSGARRSPDASWIAKTRLASVGSEQRGLLWRICPEFVIELRSPSDRLPVLQAKMREWMENGVELGWLVDPEERTVTVYRPGREPEALLDPVSVAGEGPVAGFVLTMADVWGPVREVGSCAAS